MAPAIADRRPKYVTKSCYVPMSRVGSNATDGFRACAARCPLLPPRAIIQGVSAK